MEKLVIGIDFSKETMNYCCLQGLVADVLLEGVVENSKEGCKEMIRNLRSLKSGLRVVDFLFCGENTGCYSIVVSDYLTSRGYTIWLENPLQIKLSCGIRRGKTDATDARMIGEYALRHQDKVVPYNPCSESILKLKSWLKTHDKLTEMKTSLQNLIKSLQIVPPTLEQTLENVKKQIKETDKHIKALLEKEEEFSKNASLAMSVPGISFITAAAILIDTQNFTRFTDPRKYASHTGCVPYKRESGTTVRYRPHVSKASNRHINSLLTQGAVSVMTHNDEMRAYALKKKKEAKNNGCIINNIRNKIIHRLFAVIRQQKPFDKNYKKHAIKTSENFSFPQTFLSQDYLVMS